MRKEERYKGVLDWFQANVPVAETELHYNNPYELLVAVILSAQCTDKRVNMITPALFEAFPTPEVMAVSTPEVVYEYIKSVSYPNNKAKHLVGMAKILVEEFKGIVPSDIKELQKLPGVGRKTANVVRSVAFDIPSFAVDTHVDRVSKRLGLAKPYDSVEKVEEKLKRKIDRDRWNQGHHDFIFFGRYLCTARHPQCQKCPFTSFCRKDKLEAYKQKAAQK